jgi:hypothetical protein
MRKIKTKNSTSTTEYQPVLNVVDSTSTRVQLEFEIENHIKSIRALIEKLRPGERQKYFNGLLTHLLNQPVQVPLVKATRVNDEDLSQLSVQNLTLIREMSFKLEELYRITDDTAE